MPERQPRGIRIRNQEGAKPEGTYTLAVWCINCEWEGEVEILKGTAVPWEAPLERLARCENCGCETLQRYAQSDEEEEAAGTAPQEPVQADFHGGEAEPIRRQEEEQRRWPTSVPPPLPIDPFPSPFAPLPFHGRPAMPYVGDPPRTKNPPLRTNERQRGWVEQKQSRLDNGLSDVALAKFRAIAVQPDVVNRNGDAFSQEALKNAQLKAVYGGQSS